MNNLNIKLTKLIRKSLVLQHDEDNKLEFWKRLRWICKSLLAWARPLWNYSAWKMSQWASYSEKSDPQVPSEKETNINNCQRQIPSNTLSLDLSWSLAKQEDESRSSKNFEDKIDYNGLLPPWCLVVYRIKLDSYLLIIIEICFINFYLFFIFS